MLEHGTIFESAFKQLKFWKCCPHLLGPLFLAFRQLFIILKTPRQVSLPTPCPSDVLCRCSLIILPSYLEVLVGQSSWMILLSLLSLSSAPALSLAQSRPQHSVGCSWVLMHEDAGLRTVHIGSLDSIILSQGSSVPWKSVTDLQSQRRHL